LKTQREEIVMANGTLCKTVKIALVMGDGSGPEMMAQATEIAIEAAKKDGINVDFVLTPMGWNVYDKYKDTFPAESFEVASSLGLLFFGGVGDPQFDDTIGTKHPEMRPETRILLSIRKGWGLLLNFRPMIYYKALAGLANVKAETIPDSGVEQVWLRFLLQDSYFGTSDLLSDILPGIRRRLGIKVKADVTGREEMITELAYYRRETVEKYLRAAFRYAQQRGLPIISIDKANIMARYRFWRDIAVRIGRDEFPDVQLTHQLVDSANALLFTPAKLHGVIVCGNEHGDILSDGAAGALGSMGMMCSSAVNPDTRQAMFESGAGTAPTLAGQDKANPIGRILTAGMMLRHIGAVKGAEAIEQAVKHTLMDGFRTADIASATDDSRNVLGTMAMGEKILSYL